MNSACHHQTTTGTTETAAEPPPQDPAVPPRTGPDRSPGRPAPARSGPPGRRDSRRPARAAVRGRPRLSADRWFAQQFLLVLSGRRPVHALLGHVRGHAFDQVTALAAGTPLLPRGADRRAAVLASVHGRQPSAEVIEACARFTAGGRDRAMAFRLELGEDRRWRCSAVELA